MGDVIEIEDALKGLRTALETGFRSALKDVGARLHDHIDEEIQSAGTTPPGVPQNLQLVSVTVPSASRAIATFGWDPVDGADIYQFGHVGPDGSWHRSVLTTAGDEAEVGNRAPFFLTPGAPWTAYVRAGIRVGSSIVWGMPAVLDVQIPQREALAVAWGLPLTRDPYGYDQAAEQIKELLHA